MSAEARYITPRDSSLPSDGPGIGVLASALGTPLMPWQQQVVDAACEYHPTEPGAWHYPVVVLTIPRQSGKTTLLRAMMAHRAIAYQGVQCFYTAQTGKDARARWRDLVTAVEAGPLSEIVTVRRAAGTEAMTVGPTGSFVSPFAPTAKSLHGYTPNLVCVDEAFAFDAAQGTDLMGAIVPAQQTLPDRQLWIVSTAGDSRSAWLREWVERGRQAAARPGGGVFYAEWSCPEDTDPADPAHWADWHPALGHTVNTRALADAAQTLPRGEFVRAYGNQWTRATETVISAADLDACATEQTPPTPAEVSLGYDVAPDRQAASVWAAWTDTDGTVCLRPYMTQPGTAWLIPALKEAAARGMSLWADDAGATRALTDTARQAGLTVSTLTARDMAAATGNLIDATRTHTLSLPAGALDEAAAGAAVRTLSGAQSWDRQASTGPIWDLAAATVAAWATTHRRPFWTLP